MAYRWLVCVRYMAEKNHLKVWGGALSADMRNCDGGDNTHTDTAASESLSRPPLFIGPPVYQCGEHWSGGPGSLVALRGARKLSIPNDVMMMMMMTD